MNILHNCQEFRITIVFISLCKIHSVASKWCKQNDDVQRKFNSYISVSQTQIIEKLCVKDYH